MGESFGGWVVAGYAIAAAQPGSTLPPIEKLIIAAGAIGLTQPPLPTARTYFAPEVRDEARAVLRRYPRLANEQTVAQILEQSGLIKGEPTEADLSRIRVPTLLVWGDKDEHVPLELGRKLLRTIPNARLSVFRNVGHIAPVEAPLEFARAVSEFVGR